MNYRSILGCGVFRGGVECLIGAQDSAPWQPCVSTGSRAIASMDVVFLATLNSRKMPTRERFLWLSRLTFGYLDCLGFIITGVFRRCIEHNELGLIALEGCL